jgi:membrane protease subunit HflK
VVLRFGAYARTTGPGPHWHAPYPIESVERVNVTEIRTAQHKATMLTQDENIVEVEVAAQYLIEQPEDYLFQVRLPDVTLRQVMESALREVVGRSKMDYILAEGRAEVAAKTRELMQAILKEYRTGLLVTALNMQQAQPPAAVQDAFADAIKAREDEARFRNEAQAYANGILPQARGEAARLQQEAIAYRDSITENAQGEADRFLKLLQAYRQAPDVTRERLYLETVERVLSESNKVLVDVDQGNNLFYVPLEQLMKKPQPVRMPEVGATAPRSGTFSRRAASNSAAASERIRRPARLREGR